MGGEHTNSAEETAAIVQEGRDLLTELGYGEYIGRNVVFPREGKQPLRIKMEDFLLYCGPSARPLLENYLKMPETHPRHEELGKVVHMMMQNMVSRCEVTE